MPETAGDFGQRELAGRPPSLPLLAGAPALYNNDGRRRMCGEHSKLQHVERW